MEILEEGCLPEDVHYGGWCQRCGCRVRCTQDEISWMDACDGRSSRPAVECPTPKCGRFIYLQESV